METDIKKELRRVIMEHIAKKIPKGDTHPGEMAKDCLKEIGRLEAENAGLKAKLKQLGVNI